MIKRLAAVVISVAVRGLDLAGDRVRRGLGMPVPRRGVVLYYHAVKPHQRSRFAWQMDELMKRACPVAAASPDSVALDGRGIAVTFDDGFHSVVANAVPELSERRIPFTMFVPTGCLGERPSWVRDPGHPSWDERVLSAEELRALAALPLATLGSHSVTHQDFSKLDPKRAERELVQSKADLEAVAGKTIDLFSFPHGAYNPALLAQARAVGYRRVFTVEPTLVADPRAFAIGRVAAEPDDWPLEFRLKIAGAYRWRHRLHRLIKRV